MAKISELVKTYKLLNDPNAPDWNVKFIGATILALVVIAAAGAALWSANRGDDAPANAPAATTGSAAEPGDATSCDATEVAEEMARLGTTSLPKGHVLPSGCMVA